MKLDRFHNEEINRVNRKINEYLNILEKDDYVRVDFKTSGLKNHDEAFRVITSLTKSGKYLAERNGDVLEWRLSKNPNFELNESVRQTNNSVKSTNKLQKWSLIITGVAIVVSCVFQGISLSQQKEQMQLDTKERKSDSLKEVYLMEKIHAIQKRLDSMQNEKNPSVKAAASKKQPMHIHICYTFSTHIYFLGGFETEVDDTSFHEGTSVVDTYFHCFTIGEIGHFNDSAKGNGFMCCC